MGQRLKGRILLMLEWFVYSSLAVQALQDTLVNSGLLPEGGFEMQTYKEATFSKDDQGRS